ncbi:MAG: 1-acyl-sn-glycerol-3-phosphate acyltransferase [Myxococcota bacterium]
MIREPGSEVVDPWSAMTPRYNLVVRWFARRFFGHFDLDDATVARLRSLEERGSVVYVMRYSSRLDYFLFNTLFAREGLRLSRFAHGLHFYYYRPFFEGVRLWFRRLRQRGPREGRRERELLRARERVREVTAAGESMFLFLRTARLGSRLRGRRHLVEQGKSDLDLLEEVIDGVWARQSPVFLVPLALFWRKGPRSEPRFLNLAYGAPTRPSDFAKVSAFLTTYRDLCVKVGESVDLAAFVAGRRQEGKPTIVRKVRRSLLLFLYREEKAVEGPTLRSRHKVQEEVLGDGRMSAFIDAYAAERKRSVDAVRGEAERIFREISANMNSSFLATLGVIVGWIFRRLFGSIDPVGLEKVAEYAKRHPIVLVPSHRSYFDFLILSWLFYQNHLVPPHIAARENMGFGPFGFIFRRAGAFFLRRSFDDPLYKEVFRRYVAYLVREGFTQEFFIEGGRSRTGKTLAPRLGMLSWDVEAFLAGARRELFFVPVAITYERLVEESAMVQELEGGRKKKESVLGLVRARRVLKRRFGSVCVNFGEPISLAEVLGDRREAFADDTSPEVVAEKRRFVEELGNRICERINWAMVGNATSVAAAALLGERRRGALRSELAERMGQVLELLRLQDVSLTPALERDAGEFSESIAFLLRSDLIKSTQDARGEILYYEESHRLALDVYRNVIVHYLVTPSFLARRLLVGGSMEELREDLAFWLDLFYTEFFAPKGLALAAQFDAFLDYFEQQGVLERQDGRLRVAEKGRSYLRFLAEQTRTLIEAYYAATCAVQVLEQPTPLRDVRKAIGEQFERAALIGEVERREASNPVTFGNALELLLRRGVLERRDPQKGREPLLAPGPAFDELAILRERLAGALAGR